MCICSVCSYFIFLLILLVDLFASPDSRFEIQFVHRPSTVEEPSRNEYKKTTTNRSSQREFVTLCVCCVCVQPSFHQNSSISTIKNVRSHAWHALAHTGQFHWWCALDTNGLRNNGRSARPGDQDVPSNARRQDEDDSKTFKTYCVCVFHIRLLHACTRRIRTKYSARSAHRRRHDKIHPVFVARRRARTDHAPHSPHVEPCRAAESSAGNPEANYRRSIHAHEIVNAVFRYFEIISCCLSKAEHRRNMYILHIDRHTLALFR